MAKKGGLTPNARVKELYYIMQTMERNVGGGEGIEGLYGSITRSGMQRVLDCLSKSCNLTSQSHLIDIGAGLGRPLLHALLNPGITLGSGIEIDKLKCTKATDFISRTVKELSKRLGTAEMPLPRVQCSAIEKVSTLEPATHAYSFWEGVPVDAKCAFGELFSKSNSVKSVAIVQRAMRKDPCAEMEEMSFGKLSLVSSFQVSMSGSGRSFTAYVFNKLDASAAGSPVEVDAAAPLTPTGKGEPRISVQPSQHLCDAEKAASQASDGAISPREKEWEQRALEEPQTPAIQKMQPGSCRSLTNGKATPKIFTPQSLGISGPARRIHTPQASTSATSVAKQLPLAKLLEGSHQNLQEPLKSCDGPRRPIRQTQLAAVQHTVIIGTSAIVPKAAPADDLRADRRATQAAGKRVKASAATAGSPVKAGIQKPQSPKNKTLEASGMRSRRRSTKPVKVPPITEARRSNRAKGLGAIS